MKAFVQNSPHLLYPCSYGDFINHIRGSQLSGTQDAKHLHHSFDSKPHENKPPTLISSKETKTENRHGPISETSALHLGDTSFVSVATTESDLSQLLNESSIERHLSEGQLKLHEGTPTHATTTWGQDGMETTRPQSAGRDSNTGTTTLHQSLSSATSGFTTRRPVSSSPPERLKLNAERSGSSRSAREHCAHNSRQTKSLSNTPLTLSVEINKTSDSKQPASSTTPDRDGGKGSSGMCAMDTGGGSPLSLDLDHLALQVRDKLSSIFDYSPTLPTEVTSSYHQVSITPSPRYLHSSVEKPQLGQFVSKHALGLVSFLGLPAFVVLLYAIFCSVEKAQELSRLSLIQVVTLSFFGLFFFTFSLGLQMDALFLSFPPSSPQIVSCNKKSRQGPDCY